VNNPATSGCASYAMNCKRTSALLTWASISQDGPRGKLFQFTRIRTEGFIARATRPAWAHRRSRGATFGAYWRHSRSARRVGERIRTDSGILGVNGTEFARGELLENGVGKPWFATPWVGWRAGIARTV